MNNNITCPICSNTSIEPIYDISCDRFDTSFLYQTIKLVYCIKCGHVFNYLTETELNNLNKYYNEGAYKGEYRSYVCISGIEPAQKRAHIVTDYGAQQYEKEP